MDAATTRTTPAWRTFLWLWPIVACFGLAIWHMRYDWNYDASYQFGWFVLPLTVYLVSVRWRDRPPASPSSGSSESLLPWIFLSVAVIGGWLVREANPEWRILSLWLSGLAMVASLLILHAVGGKGWVRHFFGAVLFFSVAVPWPSGIEKVVTQSLMPLNAAISEEVLLWGNVAATRRGNLISIEQGTLGVEEACSGIRSLQATHMMAWFFGELHFLSISKRFIILLTGLASALITNIVRTVTLSVIAAKSGMAAANASHDNAGLIALAANIIVILLITKKLSANSKNSLAHAAKLEPGAFWQSRPLTGTILLGVSCLAVFPITELWYRRGVATPEVPPWHLSQPKEAESFHFLPISDRTKIMLRYTGGWSARWKTPGGKAMQGMYFHWDTGQVPPENLNMHEPGGCLNAIGVKLVRELEPLTFHAGGQQQTARIMEFIDAGRPLIVLYSVSTKATQVNAKDVAFDFSYSRRWRAALHGIRNPGQRLIEIGIWDEPNEQKCRTALLDYLNTHVKENEL